MIVFLVGFMGSGKSTLGRALAERLGFTFLDLDEVMEKAEGMTIPALFVEKGQAFFREREAFHLRQTAVLDKTIFATGGGAPCFLENQAWMNANGVTIYLKVPIEVLARRLELDPNPRPLLEGKKGVALENFIRQLLMEREKFYDRSHLCCEIFSENEDVTEELATYLLRFIKD